MKIETKFNIGDEVWQAFKYLDDVWRVLNPARIKDIKNNGYGGYYYITESDAVIANYCFKYLFPTQAEAQAECDRRNA